MRNARPNGRQLEANIRGEWQPAQPIPWLSLPMTKHVGGVAVRRDTQRSWTTQESGSFSGRRSGGELKGGWDCSDTAAQRKHTSGPPWPPVVYYLSYTCLKIAWRLMWSTNDFCCFILCTMWVHQLKVAVVLINSFAGLHYWSILFSYMWIHITTILLDTYLAIFYTWVW